MQFWNEREIEIASNVTDLLELGVVPSQQEHTQYDTT